MSYVLALVIAMSSLFMPTSEAPSQAPSQALSQALAQFATQASAPVPNTSVEVAHKWADAMLESADITLKSDIQLIFSNTSNCGAELSTVGLGGCTYNLGNGKYAVVLSPELANTQWGNHILFHELGHTAGLDECGAEAYAHKFEEVELWSYPLCEETGKP